MYDKCLQLSKQGHGITLWKYPIALLPWSLSWSEPLGENSCFSFGVLLFTFHDMLWNRKGQSNLIVLGEDNCHKSKTFFSQKMFHLPKVCPLVAGWTWPAPALTWHIAKWTLHWHGTLCQYISFLLMLQVFLKMVIISLITGHFVYFSRWWQSCKLGCYASFVQYGWQWSRKVSTDQMWQEQDKTEAG